MTSFVGVIQYHWLSVPIFYSLVCQEKVEHTTVPVMLPEGDGYVKTMRSEKTKAVAVCTDCNQPVPVQVFPDGHVHPLGGHHGEIRGCTGEEYRVLNGNVPDGFGDD